jgi:hypothetical protein
VSNLQQSLCVNLCATAHYLSAGNRANCVSIISIGAIFVSLPVCSPFVSFDFTLSVSHSTDCAPFAALPLPLPLPLLLQQVEPSLDGRKLASLVPEAATGSRSPFSLFVSPCPYKTPEKRCLIVYRQSVTKVSLLCLAPQPTNSSLRSIHFTCKQFLT